MKRRYKILGIITILLIVMLHFLPAIAQWYLIKNGEDIIGRKINMSDLDVNYFRVSVTVEDFVMYESNGSDEFVAFDELYINFSPWHLFKREYAFSEIRLVKPEVSLVYSEDGFNFDDLLESSDTTAVEPEEEEEEGSTVKYLVRNLSIEGGYIRYEDKIAGSVSELKQFGVSIPEIAWDNSQSELGVDFILGDKGQVSLGGTVDATAGKYSVMAKTKDIDIAPFAGYLSSYVDVDSVSGLFYSDLSLNGDLEDVMDIRIFGSAGIKDLSVIDGEGSHFLTSGDINIVLDSLDLKNENYCIASVSVDECDLDFSLENRGSNFDRILAPYYADTLEITDVSDSLVADSIEMHYSIGELHVSNTNVLFKDYTLNRPFIYSIGAIDFLMTGYSDTAVATKMEFSMILNQEGRFIGQAVIDMYNFENIEFNAEVSDLNMISLSPYSEYFIARPVTRGAFNYQIKLILTPQSLNNSNSIKIVNMEMGKKTKDTTAYKVPVGLALYVLKDRQGVIAFDLPVYGNPSDPSFKLGKIIWKTLQEFLVKTATAPFRALANTFGMDPESIKSVPFDPLQDTLLEKQTDNLDKIAKILTEKPEFSFKFVQYTDAELEKKLIAIQKAKYLFVKSTAIPGTSEEEMLKRASSMNDGNVKFKEFLGMELTSGKDEVGMYCIQKVGVETINASFNALLEKRKSIIMNYLLSKGVGAGSIRFSMADLNNLPDEMKTPQFMVEVVLE